MSVWNYVKKNLDGTILDHLLVVLIVVILVSMRMLWKIVGFVELTQEITMYV